MTLFRYNAKLNTTTLGRTAAIVWQWCNVYDLDNLNTGTMAGTDSRLASITGALHISFHLTQAEVESDLCAILSGHLGSIRSVLLRTTEAHLTS